MRLTDEQIGAELRALRPTPERGVRRGARPARRRRVSPPAPRSGSAGASSPWRRLTPVLAGLAAVAVLVVVISDGGSSTGASPVAASSPRHSRPHRPPRSRDGGRGGRPRPGQARQPRVRGAPDRTTDRRATPQRPAAGAGALRLTRALHRPGRAPGRRRRRRRRDPPLRRLRRLLVRPCRRRARARLLLPADPDGASRRRDLRPLRSRPRHRQRSGHHQRHRVIRQTPARPTPRRGRRSSSLPEQLRNAASPSEAAAIKRRLAAARAGPRGRALPPCAGLKQRVALTPVSVEISRPGRRRRLVDRRRGGRRRRVLQAIGGALADHPGRPGAARGAAALGWLGSREFQRRRREAALNR